MPRKINLQQRHQKLLEHIEASKGVDIRLLHPQLRREVEDLAHKGFLKIQGYTAKLTPAGREALKKPPPLKATRISLKEGSIRQGAGSQAYILRARPAPAKPRPERPSINPRKTLEKARKLLLQGRYRYAATTLLPLARTPEERLEILQLAANPAPRKIAAKIRSLKETLGDTQNGKGTNHT